MSQEYGTFYCSPLTGVLFSTLGFLRALLDQQTYPDEVLRQVLSFGFILLQDSIVLLTN